MLGAAPASVSGQGRYRQPNFIVILTGHHRYSHPGCQGDQDLKTPNIDALAESGVRFTNWYSNNPVCADRYPERAEVTSNGMELAPEQRTIASLLKSKGYATGITGKWHLGYSTRGSPNALGFDSSTDFIRDAWISIRIASIGASQYLTERITEESVSFLNANSQRPFFLYIVYNAPHYPMHAPKRIFMDHFPDLEAERRTYAAMLAAVWARF